LTSAQIFGLATPLETVQVTHACRVSVRKARVTWCATRMSNLKLLVCLQLHISTTSHFLLT